MSHSGFLEELQGILQSSSILSQGVSFVPSAKKKLYPKKPAAKFLVCFELLQSPYLMVIGDFPRKIFLDTMTEGHVCCLLLLMFL